MERRNFIKYGLFGSLALLGGGLGLSLQSTKPYADTNDLWVFSVRELAILAAVAETIIPSNNEIPSALDLQVPEAIDRLLKLAHPAVQEEIKLLLGLLENASVNALLHFSPVPFSHMSLTQRTEILTKWASSSLALQRKGYKALNGLCQSAYYAQSQTHQTLGYDGPPEHLLALVRSAARKGVQP